MKLRFISLRTLTAAFLIVIGLIAPAGLNAMSAGQTRNMLPTEAGANYSLHSGFPFDIPGQVRSSPVVADINNDGHNELLVANYRGEVYAWNAAGTLLPGYPLTTGGTIDGELALGDLNSDGDLEIVAGVGLFGTGIPSRVYIWQPDGSLLPGWPKQVDLFDSQHDSLVRTVVLADMDNDLDLEIIAGTPNNINNTSAPPTTNVPDLYVWHHTGQLLNGNWPVKEGPAIRGMLAVGDLNADGGLDILVGRDDRWLYAYNNQGQTLPGWPIETLVPGNGGNANIVPRITHKQTIPTLADLDRDGVFEYIAAGVRRLPAVTGPVNSDLLVLEPDGTRRPGWQIPAEGRGFLGTDIKMDQAPTIADLNDDGRLDIVIPTQDGWIRAYNADKTLLWKFNYAQNKLIYSSEPVIGDIDNDGRYEIVFGTYDFQDIRIGPTGLWILEHDGTVKAGAPLHVEPPGIYAAPTLADLDGDSILDIIAVTQKGMVYAWSTGTPFDSRVLPWPVARQNIRRTGFVDPNSLKPTLNPSTKKPNKFAADQGDEVIYTLRLLRVGLPLTHTVQITDAIPAGLSYIPHSLTATQGGVDDSLAPSYKVSVIEDSPKLITNSASINAGPAGQITRQAGIIVNGKKSYLPYISK